MWSLILTVVKSRREQYVWVCTSHVTACLFTPSSHNRRLHLKWLWWGGLCVHQLTTHVLSHCRWKQIPALCSVCIHTRMVSSLVTSSHVFPLDRLHNALQGYVMAGSAPVNVECYGWMHRYCSQWVWPEVVQRSYGFWWLEGMEEAGKRKELQLEGQN